MTKTSKKYWVSTATRRIQVSSIAEGVREVLNLQRFYGQVVEGCIYGEASDRLAAPAGLPLRRYDQVARLVKREEARQKRACAASDVENDKATGKAGTP